MEVPHAANCKQVPETMRMSGSEKGNSQSLPNSGTGTKTRSGSNDSVGSAQSFAFPTLPVEWSGSPVRMVEADRGQARKDEWWKSFLPCCKF